MLPLPGALTITIYRSGLRFSRRSPRPEQIRHPQRWRLDSLPNNRKSACSRLSGADVVPLGMLLFAIESSPNTDSGPCGDRRVGILPPGSCG